MRPEGGLDYRKFVAYQTRISDEAAASTERLMDRWNSPPPRPKRTRSSLGVNSFYEIAIGKIVTVSFTESSWYTFYVAGRPAARYKNLYTGSKLNAAAVACNIVSNHRRLIL